MHRRSLGGGGRGPPQLPSNPWKICCQNGQWFSVPVLSLTCGLTADREDLFFFFGLHLSFGFPARVNLFYLFFNFCSHFVTWSFGPTLQSKNGLKLNFAPFNHKFFIELWRLFFFTYAISGLGPSNPKSWLRLWHYAIYMLLLKQSSLQRVTTLLLSCMSNNKQGQKCYN